MLASQRQIESTFVTAQYDRTRELLRAFEEGFGYSIWSLDVSLLLAQFQYGYHGNRTTLSLFVDSSQSDFVNFVSQNSSFRTQLNVSTQEYNSSLQFMFPKGASGYGADYFRYRFFGEIPTDE